MHPRITHEVCNVRSLERQLDAERASGRPRPVRRVERRFGEAWPRWIRRSLRARLDRSDAAGLERPERFL